MGIQDKDYHFKWRTVNKETWNQYSREYYEREKERIRIKRQSPECKSKLSAYLKEWRAKNQEKIKHDQREWHDSNAEWIKNYRAEYGERRRELYQQRKEEICARKRELSKTPKYRARVLKYQRDRRKDNIQHCLADRLRVTMNRALRRQFVEKSNRTFELIGCTPVELRAKIEALFLPGMSWENRRKWHLDHKRPLSSFDLRDVGQQKAAFHFSNLQPLWAKDNQTKSDKWEG